MGDRERLILEEPEKMCEYCCNFDKEHIGMDGTALCKLTMTLAYAEDYGGNCMFYNVPKEQIIVPPCKVGDKVYSIIYQKKNVVSHILIEEYVGIRLSSAPDLRGHRRKNYIIVWNENTNSIRHVDINKIGKTVFLTKEEAEEKLKELGK